MTKKKKKDTTLSSINAKIKSRQNNTEKDISDKRISKNKNKSAENAKPIEKPKLLEPAALPPSKKLSKAKDSDKKGSDNIQLPPEEQSPEEQKNIETIISKNQSTDDLPDAPPNENFNPYKDDTIKRPHSQPQMQLTEEEKANPIPIPIFQKPQHEDFEGGRRMSNQDEYTQSETYNSGGNINQQPADKTENELKTEKKSEPTKPEKIETKFDKATKDAFKPVAGDDESPENKKIRREMLVDTIYDGYEMLHRLGRHFTKVSEYKLQNLEIDGKLSMAYKIDIDVDNSKTIYEIIQSYNSEVDKFMRVDNDFIKKTKPSLLRICEKYGLGLSDELNIAIQLSKDVSTKLAVGYQMVKGINMILKVASKPYLEEKAEAELKISKTVPQTPVPPPEPPKKEKTETPVPPPEPPKKEKTEITEALEITMQNNPNREPEEQES